MERLADNADFERLRLGLLTDAQLTNDVEIPLWVLATHVIKKTSATTHQSKQASPRRIVFAVSAHVLGQPVNPLGQDANLHLR